MFTCEFYACLADGEFDCKMNWLTQRNKKCVMVWSADLIARWLYFFHLKSYFKQPPEKCFTTVTLRTNQKENNSFIQSHGLLMICDNFFGFESFWRSSSDYVNVLGKIHLCLDFETWRGGIGGCWNHEGCKWRKQAPNCHFGFSYPPCSSLWGPYKFKSLST